MPKVCLDPGHGGLDRYNRGPTGYVEADGVLDMALAAGEELKRRGVKVIFTRTTDTNLRWENKTVRDLNQRAKFANESSADIFVSIHTNAGGVNAKGIETYCYQKGTGGENLAGALQKALVQSLGLKNRGVKQAKFIVIKNTVMPAALTEIGFHSNPEEEALLKDPAFRKRAGIAIAQGIIDYLGPFSVEERTARVLFEGREIKFSGAGPRVIDGATYVPLRDLAEAMGFRVAWNPDKKEAVIKKP